MLQNLNVSFKLILQILYCINKLDILLEKESGFVANIVHAASRIRRTTYRKSTTSATPDTLSLDSSTVRIYNNLINLFIYLNYFNYFKSAESKEHLKRFGSDDSASLQHRRDSDDQTKNRLSEDDYNDSAFADNGK